MDILHDNPHKLVPEYHHSGFYWTEDDGGGDDNWRYNTCKAPVKSSSSCHPTNTVRAEKGALKELINSHIL